MRGKLGFAAVSLLGLALYLWGALAAPVVLWSDSEIDMGWARSGVGIFRPVAEPPPGEPLVHPPKPGYLVFLAAAMRAAPALGEARSVVLVQSFLLWLSIVGTCWFIARRSGNGIWLWTGPLLLAVFRIRDAASAVMSETICAALFLPLAALSIWKPRRPWVCASMGFGAAVLFAIRPDVGAILFLLTAAAFLAGRIWRCLGVYAASFTLLTLGVWMVTRPAPGSDPLRGAGHPVLEASATYYWRPSLGQWPRAETQSAMGRKELDRAAGNWKRTLSHLGPDTRRELVWRAFHGLLGTEFYDARWSRLYGCLDEASRLLTSFLILAAVAGLALPARGMEPGARLPGGLLLASIVGHNLVFGSNPRYLLPLLPFLLLLPIEAIAALRGLSVPRRAAWGVVLAALIVLTYLHREVLDWQWGMIETSGVRVVQPIPKGALPRRGPATLHVRIASPLMPPSAQLEIFGPGSRRLYSSLEDPARQRPYVTIPLPDWLLEVNRAAPVELSFVSQGGYGPHSYLLFPVIPPPWSTPARRDGSRELSPASGVSAGSLDWWAHEGGPSRCF
jgi:hypothetical protein